MGIDQFIDTNFAPFAEWFSNIVFYEIQVNGAGFPLVVAWLIACGIFCTLYLRVLTPGNVAHAIRLIRGSESTKDQPGQVPHFHALATALSGTVGVGNIGAVAIAITIGGPGAVFWMIVAGLLGTSLKCAECVLGVKYRDEHSDDSVSGGPMYYLSKGMAARGRPLVGRYLGILYAAFIVVGCLGIGNMFQSNQAYTQLAGITGGDDGFLGDKGWLFGLILALIVASVVIGGIKSIARVTSRLVPFMAGFYMFSAIVVIIWNADKLPWALSAIVTQAFVPEGVAGGLFAVIAMGFRRAAFSNEAGLGSASIAHSAVQTDRPATEGLVALLEPIIDTVIISTMTALVILTTVYDPSLTGAGTQGVELTSRAFETVFDWFPYILAIVVVLFAFSTIIAWGYYGQKGWTFLFGNSRTQRNIFYLIYCSFVVIGCTVNVDAIISFSDAAVFVLAVPNVLALYLFSGEVRTELRDYLVTRKQKSVHKR